MTTPTPGAPRRQPLIRRNPQPPKPPTGEWCAIHGTYTPPDMATALLYQARSPGIPTDRARAMLEESQQLRRHCPQCDGPAPRTWTPNRDPQPAAVPGAIFAAMAPTYTATGLAVFPCWPAHDGACACPRGRACKSPGKHPLLPPAHDQDDPQRKNCRGECGTWGHGLYDATTDEPTITAWAKRWPGANIGMPADRNGYAILDVDPAHNGDASEHRLREYLTQRGTPLPDTLTQTTGSGGRHYLYTAPDGGITGKSKAFGSDMPGLDTRGRGGYIIVAPSIHASGRPYTWVDFFTDPTPWPHVLTALMNPPAPAAPAPPDGRPARTGPGGQGYPAAVLNGICADVAKLGPGDGRNTRINSAAHNLGGYVAAGLFDEATARRALYQAAATCGYIQKRGARAVIQIINSGLTSGQNRPRTLRRPA